jgi:serine/threonine-protein kinase
VLDALGYSHRNGIVHRDIKPANVMIAPDGSIKVMDFGIARAMADANATMTQTSAVIGTAQYLSPEQAQGQSVDERSDLYSTGCMLFELLTGRPPFLGESPVSIAYQHVGEQPIPPSRFVEGISEDLDAVVIHSLAKPRDARYQSAGEFRADLQAVRLGRPISDAARGSAAALAGAGALAAATQVVPSLGGDQTQTYAGVPLPVDPGTDSFPGVEEQESKRGPGGWIVLTLVALAALVALVYGPEGGRATRRRRPDPDRHGQARAGQAGHRPTAPAQRHGARRHGDQPEPDGRHRGHPQQHRAGVRLLRSDGGDRARPQGPHRAGGHERAE